jgi:hypothetical protein
MSFQKVVLVAFVLFLASAVAGAEDKCWAEAEQYLGTDFVSPTDVMRVNTSMTYSATQMEELCRTIPTGVGWGDQLWWLKKGHYILMPAPTTPVSLAEIRGVGVGGDKTTFGWLAIKKEPVPGSLGKNWEKQEKLLSRNERIPNAAEVFWYVTTYFRVRGVRLFKDAFVRTASVDSNGNRVLVGFFTADNPNVCGCSGDTLDATTVGIAAAGKRKETGR